jgi:hypothetical protein
MPYFCTKIRQARMDLSGELYKRPIPLLILQNQVEGYLNCYFVKLSAEDFFSFIST